MTTPPGPERDSVSVSLTSLGLERDAIYLYDALARIEKDDERAEAFRTMAATERRHAAIWEERLRAEGAAVPPPRRPRIRVRFIVVAARAFGTRAVADMVTALEGKEEAFYASQVGLSPETDEAVQSIAAEEAANAEAWRQLGPQPPKPSHTARVRARALENGTRDGVAVAKAATSPADIVRSEKWHRAGQSGTLRATIFGVSDGLVSNTALVMGVAGADPDPSIILLSGIAGLLAGAFSMAAGEWVSMQSQRELFERQIELERAELQAMPEEEEAELAAAYRSKGFTAEEADQIAHRVFQDPTVALDTIVREELGLDPGQLGSPWGAAIGSFLAFTVGAIVPVVPYVFLSGAAAFALSLGASLAAMFLVGVAVSLLTGRNPLFSGLRQVILGGAAAGVTFLVGRLIGVSVS
ncbi:MAG: VIT1/CCC1 transporter family protein [Chloroflexi bacterium]|jgi:VIT1/CCC1 family predicted Fe2+/Mn2+ transporter|nr:VIT1/CCC1 transporter family protein [Chloroflexota bacterium]